METIGAILMSLVLFLLIERARCEKISIDTASNVEYISYTLDKGDTIFIHALRKRFLGILLQYENISVVTRYKILQEDIYRDYMPYDISQGYIYNPQIMDAIITANGPAKVSLMCVCVPEVCKEIWFTNDPSSSFIVENLDRDKICVLFATSNVITYDINVSIAGNEDLWEIHHYDNDQNLFVRYEPDRAFYSTNFTLIRAFFRFAMIATKPKGYIHISQGNSVFLPRTRVTNTISFRESWFTAARIAMFSSCAALLFLLIGIIIAGYVSKYRNKSKAPTVKTTNIEVGLTEELLP